MPTVTGSREIDRKLYRIVREADSSLHPTAIALGRALEKAEAAEFAYQRGRKTEYATANTVAEYVLYARDIGLLNGDLDVTRQKADVRSLENFQQWLGDIVIRYLRDNNASIDQLQSAVDSLLSSTPRELPTVDNVYKTLKSPPPKHTFRLSLKVISFLRPKALRLRSRRLIIPSAILLA